MAIHPEIQALLDLRVATGAPAFHTLSAEAARAGQAAARAAANVTPPRVHEVRDIDEGPVPMRLYRPDMADAQPALVFLHGGGWATGDLDSHDILCRRLALASGVVIVAVNYRLAPEHPAPAGRDDCCAALDWVIRQAGRLGLDPGRIGIGGDSAGGNLAALAALHARDSGGPAPAALFLLYPATDLRFGYPSYDETLPGLPVDGPAMEAFRAFYLSDPALADRPDISPLLADLRGLPHSYILTLGHDPLRDEGLAFATALTKAGVSVTADHLPDRIHGILTLGTAMPSVVALTRMLGSRLGAMLAKA
ncbi:alpha/beta hydrolase [Mesobacterium pallidum]|uniref:alpha/beta hydrolase n=1 Tax=Mesobacterium pallidum TaxID=2872037 RepID=UPI001EE30676|nr:alpha/beta hydrolase [Mesobacterium pallidum]